MCYGSTQKKRDLAGVGIGSDGLGYAAQAPKVTPPAPQVSATIKRPEPVPTPPATVTLTMDEETAKTLYAAVGKVVGRDDGPRGQMNKVYYALQDALGVPGYTPEINGRFTGQLAAAER